MEVYSQLTPFAPSPLQPLVSEAHIWINCYQKATFKNMKFGITHLTQMLTSRVTYCKLVNPPNLGVLNPSEPQCPHLE